MTEQEQYEIIGKVVSEHEQVKRDLAAARAKASSLGELLSAFGSALRYWNSMGRPASESTARRYAGYQVEDGTIKATYDHRTHAGAWPSIDELEGLINEIKSLEQAETALQHRRKELGVS